MGQKVRTLRPPSQFPAFPWGGVVACPWAQKGPKIGIEGAVLENFGKFTKKVA